MPVYKTTEQARAEGFATFNDCPTLCVDLPDGGCTISAKTSDGRRITFAFLSYRAGQPPECVDIAYHDNGTSRETNGKGIPTFDVIAFGPPNKGLDYDSRRAAPEGAHKPGIVCVLMETPATKERHSKGL